MRDQLQKMSARHQEELIGQVKETEWLKRSLLECSTALHQAVTLLQRLESVPEPILDIVSKYNSENVSSACKCSVGLSPSFLCKIRGLPANLEAVADSIAVRTAPPTQPLSDAPAPTTSLRPVQDSDESFNGSRIPSHMNLMPSCATTESPASEMPLFRFIQKDANGMYVIGSSKGAAAKKLP